jgi:apolipoprotein N-acyltransferase
VEALISRLAAWASRYGAALLSGLLLALSFPNIFHPDFFPPGPTIAWFCLVPLLASIEGESPREAFNKGYVAGLFFFLLSTAWINNIGPMGPGALPAWISLCMYLALYPAIFAWGLARGRAWRWPFEPLWIPALWTLLEFLRERLLTGYPWISLGSSQAAGSPWLGLAALTGVYGLHFAVALCNLLAYWIYRRSPKAWAAAALLAIFALLRLLAPAPIQSGPVLKVAVFQGNVDQDQAWTQDYRNALMDDYGGMMREAVAAGAKLLVWPESAFPGFYNEDPPEAMALRAFAKKNNVDLIVGSSLEFGPGTAYANAAVFMDAQGNTAAYLKRHLVPFGEYIPLRRRIPLLDRAMNQFGMVDFSPGAPQQQGFVSHGLGVEPVICYESIYGEMVRKPLGSADLCAVITLDTWFGDSAAPRVHFLQGALRAVENGVWVARAAATGISGFIGPDGKVFETVALNQRGWAMHAIPLQGSGSFYRSRGPWFLWLCGGILAVCGLISLIRFNILTALLFYVKKLGF